MLKKQIHCIIIIIHNNYYINDLLFIDIKLFHVYITNHIPILSYTHTTYNYNNSHYNNYNNN